MAKETYVYGRRDLHTRKQARARAHTNSNAKRTCAYCLLHKSHYLPYITITACAYAPTHMTYTHIHIVGLFRHIVGLFCHIVGLSCHIVGLFRAPTIDALSNTIPHTVHTCSYHVQQRTRNNHLQGNFFVFSIQKLSNLLSLGLSALFFLFFSLCLLSSTTTRAYTHIHTHTYTHVHTHTLWNLRAVQRAFHH